jgi:hypothetical protein
MWKDFIGGDSKSTAISVIPAHAGIQVVSRNFVDLRRLQRNLTAGSGICKKWLRCDRANTNITSHREK